MTADTARHEARQLLKQVREAARVAQEACERAEAEVDRLELLAFAEKWPTLTAFQFNADSEYNDEGGYYIAVSPQGVFVGDDEPEGWDEGRDDLCDLQVSQDSMCLLTGDEWEGVVTVDQLKELSFG